MPGPSLLAQVSGGYTASRSTAGDVTITNVLTIPATTPGTTQPPFIVVRVASSVQGSGNGDSIGEYPYHVDFIPSDGSAPFGIPYGGGSQLGTLQYPNAYAFALYFQSDARIAVGGTLTLSVTLNPSAAAAHPWFGHAGTSDQGSISALVLDPQVGSGVDARMAFGTFTGTNSGTSRGPDSVPIPAGVLGVWQHASISTSGVTLTGFTSATNTQSGSTMTGSANNATTFFATTYETASETLSATWTWATSSVSYEAFMYIDSTTHVAPPSPYAPPVTPIAMGRGWTAVIG